MASAKESLSVLVRAGKLKPDDLDESAELMVLLARGQHAEIEALISRAKPPSKPHVQELHIDRQTVSDCFYAAGGAIARVRGILHSFTFANAVNTCTDLVAKQNEVRKVESLLAGGDETPPEILKEAYHAVRDLLGYVLGKIDRVLTSHGLPDESKSGLSKERESMAQLSGRLVVAAIDGTPL